MSEAEVSPTTEIPPAETHEAWHKTALGVVYGCSSMVNLAVATSSILNAAKTRMGVEVGLPQVGITNPEVIHQVGEILAQYPEHVALLAGIAGTLTGIASMSYFINAARSAR